MRCRARLKGLKARRHHAVVLSAMWKTRIELADSEKQL
jgi:hypothetical protein